MKISLKHYLVSKRKTGRKFIMMVTSGLRGSNVHVELKTDGGVYSSGSPNHSRSQ